MKTDREKRPIFCTVTATGLRPAAPADAEALDRYKHGSEVEITIKQDLAPESIKVQIEKLKWIVQFNGDNIDTYCSKQCAR